MKTLKAGAHYFLTNVYFSANDSPSKALLRAFLFHLKSSFRSQDIKIFVFPSFPIFPPVSHCFRA